MVGALALMWLMMRQVPTAGPILVVPFVLASVSAYGAWVSAFFLARGTSARTWRLASLAYLAVGAVVVVVRADPFHAGNALLVPVWPSFLLWRDGCVVGLWECPS